MSTTKTKPAASTAVSTKEPVLKTVGGTSLALAAPDLASDIAAALVPIRPSQIADRVAAIQRMLETPFVSAQAAAEQNLVVTLLNVTESEIQAIGQPEGTMVEQFIFMASLQTPIRYVDRAGGEHDHERGEIVLIGQRKNKVRNLWADLVRDAAKAGEDIPNVVLSLRPNKDPKLNASVSFSQIRDAS